MSRLAPAALSRIEECVYLIGCVCYRCSLGAVSLFYKRRCFNQSRASRAMSVAIILTCDGVTLVFQVKTDLSLCRLAAHGPASLQLE